MTDQREKILVVESDLVLGDLIARQALGSQDYDVKVVEQASNAIRIVEEFEPDVLIANLELPGLSGKDLMVALSSQKHSIPMIVIADQGQEKDIIQAFRLGASDYISAPVRETEVVAVVERALNSVRARKEREHLSRVLESTNLELKRKVNELTTIFGVGKAVTSIVDQVVLFDQIVEGVVTITEADYGWLLIQDEITEDFLLRAHKNLPKSLASNMGKPWDDGISSLVAVSGKTFEIHGEPIKRFLVASLGKAAMVSPIKVGKQTIALLVVLRKKERAFDKSNQDMLEAVCDYASISMSNARLFRALDERAARLQAAAEKSKGNEYIKDEIIQALSSGIRSPLAESKAFIDSLVEEGVGEIDRKKLMALENTQALLGRMVGMIEAIQLMNDVSSPKQLKRVNLMDLINRSVRIHQKKANKKNCEFKIETEADVYPVFVDEKQIDKVLDALLLNAIIYTSRGGEINIEVGQPEHGYVQVTVKDHGMGISKKDIDKIFDQFYQVELPPGREIQGLGTGLALVKRIITAHGGKVWVESKLELGSTFHFELPLHLK